MQRSKKAGKAKAQPHPRYIRAKAAPLNGALSATISCRVAILTSRVSACGTAPRPPRACHPTPQSTAPYQTGHTRICPSPSHRRRVRAACRRSRCGLDPPHSGTDPRERIERNLPFPKKADNRGRQRYRRLSDYHQRANHGRQDGPPTPIRHGTPRPAHPHDSWGD